MVVVIFLKNKIKENHFFMFQYFYSHGEKLRLSNLLRLMVSSKDALVLTDKVGRIVHANKAWSDLTGYHLRDVEGKTCKFLQVFFNISFRYYLIN